MTLARPGSPADCLSRAGHTLFARRPASRSLPLCPAAARGSAHADASIASACSLCIRLLLALFMLPSGRPARRGTLILFARVADLISRRSPVAALTGFRLLLTPIDSVRFPCRSSRALNINVHLKLENGSCSPCVRLLDYFEILKLIITALLRRGGVILMRDSVI